MNKVCYFCIHVIFILNVHIGKMLLVVCGVLLKTFKQHTVKALHYKITWILHPIFPKFLSKRFSDKIEFFETKMTD